MKRLIAIALLAMPVVYAGDAGYQACGKNKDTHVTVCSDKGTKDQAEATAKYLNAQMVLAGIDDTVQFYVRKFKDADRGPLSALFPKQDRDTDDPSVKHL